MSRYSLTQWQILCYTLSEPLRTLPIPPRLISNELGKKFAYLEDFEADMEVPLIDAAKCARLPPDWWGTPVSDEYMRVFSWLAWETRKLTEAEQDAILRVVEQVRQPGGVPALPLRDRLAAEGAVLRPE
jgi:hypothetical protein